MGYSKVFWMVEIKFELSMWNNNLLLSGFSDNDRQSIMSFGRNKTLTIYQVYVTSMKPKVIEIQDLSVKIIDGHGHVIRAGEE